MKKIKVCPICGTEMKIDTSAVCTSIPPMYRCVCPSCNCLDFIKTSEYDQYKEEPSLPSDHDEAAEKLARIAYPYKVGMKGLICENSIPIFKDGFKAGAEWMKAKIGKQAREQLAKDEITLADLVAFDEGCSLGRRLERQNMMKDAVEGVVCYGSKGAYIETDFLGEYDTDVYGNSGDKVRVIVIKEDK